MMHGMTSGPLLRQIAHPGQAETLVHLCGRPRSSAPPDVLHLTPAERLERIVQTGLLRAFPPYGSSWPVISFTESDVGGVAALIGSGGWQPWGIVTTRGFVWENGGGPVWYVRSDMEEEVRSALPPRAASFLVRTAPQASDWLHEREWRLPGNPGSSGVRLGPGDVLALLVGNRDWEPRLEMTMDLSPISGRVGIVERTPHLALVPRWHWTGQAVEILEPVQIRVYFHE
jgi:hypothetical protein